MCQWDDWRKGSSALSTQATSPNSEREREREKRGRRERETDRDGETERETHRESWNVCLTAF